MPGYPNKREDVEPWTPPRNPQYLGLAGLLAGITIAARSGLAAAVAASVWTSLNRWIPSEERHLARVFGDRYRDHLARTRRRL